jgi:hypothetical protein
LSRKSPCQQCSSEKVSEQWKAPEFLLHSHSNQLLTEFASGNHMLTLNTRADSRGGPVSRPVGLVHAIRYSRREIWNVDYKSCHECTVKAYYTIMIIFIMVLTYHSESTSFCKKEQLILISDKIHFMCACSIIFSVFYWSHNLLVFQLHAICKTVITYGLNSCYFNWLAEAVVNCFY